MSRHYVLEQRPDGAISPDNLVLREQTLASPGPGQVRIRTTMLSVDPTNRIWMGEHDSYLPALPLGSTMRAIGAGVVEESQSPELPVGTRVSGLLGFTEELVVPAEAVRPLPEMIGDAEALGVLGHTGLTAYFGLHDVGKPEPGQTVLVSAAAGATGSIVCQLARLHGCRVVGTAGSDEKCAWLTDALGVDVAINYRKTPALVPAVTEACPNGVDVFFDNVGGAILEAALLNLSLHARIVICGAISQYNERRPRGPAAYMQLVIKRARMEGFLISDYAPRFQEAAMKMAGHLQAGKLKHKTHVVEGFERLHEAFELLFSGGNDGKLLLKV